MKKYILHKPSSKIYLLTIEPDSNSFYLKGMGSYSKEVCVVIEPRNKVEEMLFHLLWLYQSNIENGFLKYKIINGNSLLKQWYYKKLHAEN